MAVLCCVIGAFITARAENDNQRVFGGAFLVAGLGGAMRSAEKTSS